MFRTRKRLLYCLLAIAVAAGCIYAYFAIRNAYYQSQLNEVIAALDAREPGWRWEDRFATLPKAEKEESLAEELKVLMRLLTIDEYRGLLGRNAWGIESDRIEASPLLEEERSYYQNHPEARIDSDFNKTYTALHQMDPGPEAIQRLLNLGARKTIPFAHKYRGEILSDTLLIDVQATRNLIQLLRWKSALHLEANEAEEAAKHISAMLMITRVYDNDPFWICQLVRAAELQATTQTTQRLLAQSTTTSAATLKRLQEEFTSYEQYLTSISELLRWERAIIDHDLAEVEKIGVGNHFYNIAKQYRMARVYTNVQWIDEAILRMNPMFMLESWGRPRHLAIERKETLEHYERVLQWAQSPEHELLSRYQAMKAVSLGLPPFVYALLKIPGNALALKDYKDDSYYQLERITKTHLTMRAQCRTMATALAAERFRVDQQRWPTNLQELAPKYLDTVPLDPFTGKPLLLKHEVDGITIYSVGINGIDQQGTIFPFDKQQANDIGYRLWNPDKRRQDHSTEIKKALEDSSK